MSKFGVQDMPTINLAVFPQSSRYESKLTIALQRFTQLVRLVLHLVPYYTQVLPVYPIQSVSIHVVQLEKGLGSREPSIIVELNALSIMIAEKGSLIPTI